MIKMVTKEQNSLALIDTSQSITEAAIRQEACHSTGELLFLRSGE